MNAGNTMNADSKELGVVGSQMWLKLMYKIIIQSVKKSLHLFLSQQI